MEKTKLNVRHSYSQDFLLITAFQSEINYLTVNKKDDNITPIVEEYLRNRMKELKDRWK